MNIEETVNAGLIYISISFTTTQRCKRVNVDLLHNYYTYKYFS